MAVQPINTLKNWFITKAKPLSVQFWHWMDSYWHKDEDIPSAKIDGLQQLLDAKVDKKDAVDPDQVGQYDPAKNYVYDAQRAEYVSFSNPQSSDPQFQVEGFYRLTEDAPAGENPETHPAHWKYQGFTIGEMTIDDVVGLREELDTLGASDGIVLSNPADQSLSAIAQNVGEALAELKASTLAIRDAVRRLAGAAATIVADPLPQPINTAPTIVDFSTSFASTNTDVLTVDDITNLMTLFLAGRWQFSTFIAVQNSSAQDRVLTLRIVNNDTDAVINERTIDIPKNSTIVPPLSTVPFDVTQAPITIRLEWFADGTDVSVIDLETTLTTSGGNSAGAAGLPSTWEANKAAIRAITGYQHGIDVGDYETGAIYEFDSTLTAADDNGTYLTPGDIVEPAPGRWVKRKTFLTEGVDTEKKPTLVEPFNSDLSFDVKEKYFNKLIQSGVITFTISDFSYGFGASHYLPLRTSGANIILPPELKKIANEYNNDVADYDLIMWLISETEGRYSLTKLGEETLLPIIIGFSGLGMNLSLDVFLNQPVFGDNIATTPIVTSDLRITNFVAGGATAVSIANITKTNGNPLVGGETEVRVTLSYTGIPDGTETFQIQPVDGASIFNATGVAMSASATTGTVQTVLDTPVSSLLAKAENLSLTGSLVNSWIDRAGNFNAIHDTGFPDARPIFDELNEYIDFDTTETFLKWVGAHANLSILTDYTIVVKVNITELINQGIITSNISSTDRFGLSIYNGYFSAGNYDGAWKTKSSDTPATVGEHTLTVINTNGAIAFRVDGSFQSGTGNTLVNVANNLAIIGGVVAGSNTNEFKGKIKSIKLYDSALTGQSLINSEQ